MRVVRGTEALINASVTKGWAIGHMQAELGRTNDFEVKLWRYDMPPDYPKKIFHGTEFIVIYGGAIKLILEKDDQIFEVILEGKSHDYVIIEPGICKQVFVLEMPAFGITVRWPSAPGVNQVI